MKKSVLFILPVLVFISVAADAQDKPCKFKPKGASVKLRDASRAARRVRQELEAVFARRVQAVKNKDAETQISQVSPDYSASRPNGQTLNYEQIANYMRRGADQFVAVTYLSITIEGLTIRDNEALVDARQRFARTQRLRDGNIHCVVTGVLQRETWVRTSEGWKLRRVDNLREQSMIVDGRPVDPNNP
jgi:Domain of unknown function (DUF4440)